jgi:NADP-dependent 3-hydroxy acid dehydrogenase YdfG
MNGNTLDGRRALVSGAGSGIGAAIARALADGGAQLTLLGRRGSALEATRATLAGNGHRCVVADVTDAATLTDLGPTDLLINNAGQALSAPFAKADADHWRRLLDVNLMGSVHLNGALAASSTSRAPRRSPVMPMSPPTAPPNTPCSASRVRWRWKSRVRASR